MKKAMYLSKLFAFVLCLILLALPIASCKTEPGSEIGSTAGASDSESGTGSQVGPSDEIPDGVTAFPVELLSQMKIVYRQGVGEELIAAADTLAAAIQATFGTEVPVTSDYLRADSEIYTEREYEIIVGETAREVDDSFKGLRANDYRYGVSGKKIVLMGGTDYSSILAASTFTYDIVTMNKGKGKVFFRSDWSKEERGTYSLESLTLCGTDIRSWSIVYPRNGSKWEAGLAEHLADYIELLTGYSLAVVKDTKAYADGFEILIGKTSRVGADVVASTAVSEREGIIGAVGNKQIVLSGADTYGIKSAIDSFLREIEASVDAEKKASVSVSGVKTVKPSAALDTMTFNVKVGDQTPDRKVRVGKVIYTYLPDVIGIQEADSSWLAYFENFFGSYYTMVGDAREPENKGERTMIFVAKSRLSVLESGTRWLTDTPEEVSKLPDAAYYRIYTWAKLQDAVTEQQILHINTHLDTSSESVRNREVNYLLDFLSDHEDLPILLTGDLNADRTSTTIQMLQKAGLTSTDTMWQGKNELPTIDWLFVSADCASVSYYRVCNERVNGYYPSDHYPVLSRITFFTPDGGIDHDYGRVDVLPTAPADCLQPSYDNDGSNYGPIHRP